MDSSSNNKPKVTIAVAVYNVAEFIEQCARSLFEQTLDDIEIIFVDDATLDDSVAIIEKTLSEYPNRREQVRILHHEHNMGLPQTRKDALEAAQGEYIIFMDGDDWVEPRYAELLYNRAQETRADMVVCDYYKQFPSETIKYNMAPNGEGEQGKNLRNDMLNWRVTHFLWCRLIRRGLFAEHEIAWSKGNFGEDMVIVTQITYFAQRLSHVGEALYNYRYNQNSIIHSIGEEKAIKRFEEYKVNCEIVLNFARRNHMENQYENLIFMAKTSTKNKILDLIDKPKYWWKYLRTYPEINWLFLFGNKHCKPTWRERVWILTIFIGQYPKQKRRLSKYHCPRESWLPATAWMLK